MQEAFHSPAPVSSTMPSPRCTVAPSSSRYGRFTLSLTKLSTSLLVFLFPSIFAHRRTHLCTTKLFQKFVLLIKFMYILLLAWKNAERCIIARGRSLLFHPPRIGWFELGMAKCFRCCLSSAVWRRGGLVGLVASIVAQHSVRLGFNAELTL